jgi:hypothetical protein
MQNTMLYRCPGPHALHGGMYDYVIVPDEQIAETLKAGWFLTTPEALAASQAPAPAEDAEPTREELEQKAKELGIKFDGRTTDNKLGALIDAKLAA